MIYWLIIKKQEACTLHVGLSWSHQRAGTTSYKHFDSKIKIFFSAQLNIRNNNHRYRQCPLLPETITQHFVMKKIDIYVHYINTHISHKLGARGGCLRGTVPCSLENGILLGEEPRKGLVSLALLSHVRNYNDLGLKWKVWPNNFRHSAAGTVQPPLQSGHPCPQTLVANPRSPLAVDCSIPSESADHLMF